MSHIAHCPTCRAKMVKYPHTINKPLCQALIKLRSAGQANIAELGLSHNQICNFQKLRYWGLVKKAEQKGVWIITEHGENFCDGLVKVHKTVMSFRGQFDSYLGEELSINEILNTDYKQREEYIKDAIPVNPGSQLDLF